MACPFFVPTARMSGAPWVVAPRLPLNDTYRGVCRASTEEFEPAERSQRELCNCGYARGICEHFPESAADAVRFSIVSDDAGILRLIFVMEKEHAPESCGVLEYNVEESCWIGEVQDPLASQGRAFLASYLERK